MARSAISDRAFSCLNTYKPLYLNKSPAATGESYITFYIFTDKVIL